MKVLKGIATTIFFAVMIWVAASYIDIVADNTRPNPVHHPYNAFVLLTGWQDEGEEVERDGQCGNPIQPYVRIACGWIIDKDGDLLTIEDEDGNIWEVEVGYGENFEVDEYLCIFFDKMDTDNIEDDEIVKLWKEVW